MLASVRTQPSTMFAATATAQPNIALVKYWGKRNADLNLPAVGSISVTLKVLQTRTRVQFDTFLSADSLLLDGKLQSGAELLRVQRFLELVRARAGRKLYAHVESDNNFPTKSGLASSAAGFAALALAATRALGLTLPQAELAQLARRGSGSAPRSLFGGFVEMHRGELDDGSDAIATRLLSEQAWPLAILVVITDSRAKRVGSSFAMEQSRQSSPYYGSWIAAQPADLASMRTAIAEHDFGRLGEIAEHSALKMHAVAMAAEPGLLFWNGATIELVHAVRQLRRQGTEAYFTIDAGPQVKVLCAKPDAERVLAELAGVPGVEKILRDEVGSGACVVEESR